MVTCFAGDLEEGDIITAANGLRFLSTGTGEPEPATLPAKGLRVALVREQHPSDPTRVCFMAAGTRTFYELHRAAMVRLVD